MQRVVDTRPETEDPGDVLDSASKSPREHTAVNRVICATTVESSLEIGGKAYSCDISYYRKEDL